MIKIIPEGDIFKVIGVSNYAHGCNCMGAMGKGIALQFKHKYPQMYRNYKQMCTDGKFVPGDVYDYDSGEGHVFNLATEKSWHTGAKIEYIEKSLRKMFQLAIDDKVDNIAMPTIGAGLGGLKWEEVLKTIIEVAADYPEVTLHIVEKYKAD